MIVMGIFILLGGTFGAVYAFLFVLCVLDCFLNINVTAYRTDKVNKSVVDVNEKLNSIDGKVTMLVENTQKSENE